MNSEAQVNRINLGRLVKRLEDVVSDDTWADGDRRFGGNVWVKVQGMLQKIKYARQLLLDVDQRDQPDSRVSPPITSQQKRLQTIRETLNRLENTVNIINQRLEPEPVVQTSYLSLVSLPTTEETTTPDDEVVDTLAEAEFLSSDAAASEPHPPLTKHATDPALDLLPSSSTPRTAEPTKPSSISNPLPSASLLSSSLQTQDELSNELSRMAAQLKRNAQYFSESLDKDKAFLQSAGEVLEKNYDTMTKERVRLKDHGSKSSGTTWMVITALIAVSIAWAFTFIIIRFT